MAIAALLGLLLVACGNDPAPQPSAEPDGVRLAAVGDSITEADSPDYAAGDLGPESWVYHAVAEDIAFVGGWARWGATSTEMAEAVAPVEADVLVIMAGTNDTGLQTPFEETAASIAAIGEVVGAEQVLLAGVPPMDGAPQAATLLNAELEELAHEQGWHWVDAGAAVRSGESFAPGMASDGVHPTEEGAEHIGQVIGEAVREIAGR